jgi:hypothetical protein
MLATIRNRRGLIAAVEPFDSNDGRRHLVRVSNYFSIQPPPLSTWLAGRLRSAVQAQQNSERLGAPAALLDTVLEGVLQLPSLEWRKASAIGAEWSQRLINGENFKPRRLWLGSNGALLPVFDEDVKQIGIGIGRRSVARVVEWLRKSQQKIALLTNGVQWRLIHAGPDYDAWCEWDIALWFEQGEPSDQVRALLHLLSATALTPKQEGDAAPHLAAIQDTRKGQAELSANLGERVRLAIEHIIHSSGEVIDHLRSETIAVSPRDVYIAATRLVMRCVVVLFAEARELLPRTDPVYNDSYSIQGLREQLDRRSRDSLRNQFSAWPRLLSLFQLIYEGSSHPTLLVRQYGGGLFQPGQAGSTDPVLRALALFEHSQNAPSDHSIHQILELLTRAWERVPPRLPFGFLDHKMKTGNALIGCWFDRFQDYPAMAWERDGGDKWTSAIKERKEKVKAELVLLIRTRRQQAFEFLEKQLTPVGVHDELVNVFERIHSLPIHDTEERQRVYERHFGPGTAYRQLRAAFDTWCAIWFWPGDKLAEAPLPMDFLQPSAKAKDAVRELQDATRFFHWELEFPDVFNGANPGFDAIIGNPPWEVQKPNSKEFFSDIDPLYRGYGKQEALVRQKEYFENDPNVELNWINYGARLKARSNWVKYAGHPFGDQVTTDNKNNRHYDFPLDKKFEKSEADHKFWAAQRKGLASFADPAHPFLHQGTADLNTYKMFLEAGHALLRQGGRLALLVPSGIYSDQGAGSLRRLFLEKAHWSHLYAFQNERFIFGAIDHRFKVAAIQVEKGGKPDRLRTRFRLGPGDSPEVHELENDIPDENGYLWVSVSEIEEFSPHSRAILEIRTARDLEIVKKLYVNGILLGDKSADGWKIRYTAEFHMTGDSKLFPPLLMWEQKGYGWILRDCDRPIGWLRNKPNTRKLDTKAFWRLEMGTEPELRSTVLAQIALEELHRVGVDEFLGANAGDGWMLPVTLRLADYGLGHDERAKEHQPVAAALGPRFYPWQLEQSVEESWTECERHAEILAKLLPSPESKKESDENSGGAPLDLFGIPLDTDLFGNVIYSPQGIRK